MKYFLGLLLGLLSIQIQAFENNKYQYENFLNSSDRGKYIQEQLDSSNSLNLLVGDKKCKKLLKFKQVGNNTQNLQLQILCKGFDEELHITLSKSYDALFIVNTCEEVNKKNEFNKCEKSIK